MGRYTKKTAARLRDSVRPGRRSLVRDTETGLELTVPNIVRASCDASYEPRVIIRDSVVIGFSEAVFLQACSKNPAKKLAAFYNALSVLLLRARGAGLVSPLDLRVLVGACELLNDMKERRANALVAYASRPGRGGQRKQSGWQDSVRMKMAVAACARHKADADRAQISGAKPPPFNQACQVIWNNVQSALTYYRLNLFEIFPGGWRRNTPEARERKHVAQKAGGGRIQDWYDGFKGKNDPAYKKNLTLLEGADPEQFCSQNIADAVELCLLNAVPGTQENSV